MPSIAEYRSRRVRLGWVTTLLAGVVAYFAIECVRAIRQAPGAWGRLAAVALACLAVVVIARVLDRRLARAERVRVLRAGCNVCVECGFDVSGLPRDATCPECGVTHETRTRIARWREALGIKPVEPLPKGDARG